VKSIESKVSREPSLTTILANTAASSTTNNGGTIMKMREIRLLPILYAMQSAFLGSLSVMLAKALSSLIRSTFDGDNQLTNAAFWIVLILWVVAMLFWLTRMNKALRMFDGVIIIPTLQVFWILSSILSGGIFYREFSDYSDGSLVGFTFSVLVILAGVVLLTSKMKKRKDKPSAEQQQGMSLISPSKSAVLGAMESSQATMTMLIHEDQDDDEEISLVAKVSLVLHWNPPVDCDLDDEQDERMNTPMNINLNNNNNSRIP